MVSHHLMSALIRMTNKTWSKIGSKELREVSTMIIKKLRILMKIILKVTSLLIINVDFYLVMIWISLLIFLKL